MGGGHREAYRGGGHREAYRGVHHAPPTLTIPSELCEPLDDRDEVDAVNRVPTPKEPPLLPPLCIVPGVPRASWGKVTCPAGATVGRRVAGAAGDREWRGAAWPKSANGACIAVPATSNSDA